MEPALRDLAVGLRAAGFSFKEGRDHISINIRIYDITVWHDEYAREFYGVVKSKLDGKEVNLVEAAHSVGIRSQFMYGASGSRGVVVSQLVDLVSKLLG